MNDLNENVGLSGVEPMLVVVVVVVLIAAWFGYELIRHRATTNPDGGNAEMSNISPIERENLTYAFGHMVSAFSTDAHAGDSGELADECFRDLGYDDKGIERLRAIAEDVAGNYEYTGKADDYERRIKAGEV